MKSSHGAYEKKIAGTSSTVSASAHESRRQTKLYKLNCTAIMYCDLYITL